MKNAGHNKSLQKLSLSIGNFIRYWGFRRIHGAIWTQLFVSKVPLSCTELTRRLAVSKSLVSPALEELCKYKLILETTPPDEKTKLYIAAPDVNKVIQHVLKTREVKMLNQISKDYMSTVENVKGDKNIDSGKMKHLGEMIFSANMMLTLMVNQSDIFKMTLEHDE